MPVGGHCDDEGGFGDDDDNDYEAKFYYERLKYYDGHGTCQCPTGVIMMAMMVMMMKDMGPAQPGCPHLSKQGKSGGG